MSVPFTSELSVAGFALAQEAGYTPLQVVQGVFIEYTGTMLPDGYVEQDQQGWPRDRISTPRGLAATFDQARFQALKGLFDQATEAGADGVIGLRLRPGVVDWNAYRRDLPAPNRVQAGRVTQRAVSLPIEHHFLGTAVRGPTTSDRGAWITTLDGGDLWKLTRAGWRPLALVTATAFRFAVGRGLYAGFDAGEVEPATAAWREARGDAYAKLRAAATGYGADGVIAISETPRWGTTEFELPVLRSSAAGEHGGQVGLQAGVELIGTAVGRGEPPQATGDATAMIILK